MSNADLADFEFKAKAGQEPSVRLGLMAPVLAWTLVLAALAVAGPIEGACRDYGVEVGSIMQWIAKISDLWLVPAIAVGFVLLLHYKLLEELAKLKEGWTYRRVWTAMMMTPPLLILGVMVLATGSTLIRLVSNLS